MNTTVEWHSRLCKTVLSSKELYEEVMFMIKRYGINVFNECHYNTYYGNFAHYISTFLLQGPIIFETKEEKSYCYLNLLFHLVENDHLCVNALDYYDDTPLSSLKLYNKKNKSISKIIEWILEKKLVIIQQSYIRRWIAIRRVQRIRLKKVLLSITLSPPKQVGLISFCHFNGGSDYLKCQKSFEKKVVS